MSQSTTDRDAFQAAIAANPNDATTHLIFADWLDEQGETDAAASERRAGEAIAARMVAERHAAFLRTFLARAGVVGGNQFTLTALADGITRRRGKAGPRSRKYAEQLQAALQRRADRRWALATKGQRTPTPRQAVAMARDIETSLDAAEGRCTERRVSAQQVIAWAREAARTGLGGGNGGTVTASSYGYRWTTTTVSCRRQPSGTVEATVDRSTRQVVEYPAKWWDAVSLDSAVLAGGGVVAIRRKYGWDCYDGNGDLVGVAIPAPAANARRWSKWEHGRTVAEAQAEVARKADILADEERVAAERKEAEAVAAKRAAREDRAARLLARIGTRTTVGYDDARAAGACDMGIRAFAVRIGVDLGAQLSLTQVAAVEPTWAVKLARRIIAARRSPVAV